MNHIALLTDNETEQKLIKIKFKLIIGIKNHKDKNNMTQKELALKCGLTQSRISTILNGHILKVSIDELMRVNYELGIKVKVITFLDFV